MDVDHFNSPRVKSIRQSTAWNYHVRFSSLAIYSRFSLSEMFVHCLTCGSECVKGADTGLGLVVCVRVRQGPGPFYMLAPGARDYGHRNKVAELTAHTE